MANSASTKSRRLRSPLQQSRLYGDHILRWTWLYRRRNRKTKIERVGSMISSQLLLYISSIMPTCSDEKCAQNIDQSTCILWRWPCCQRRKEKADADGDPTVFFNDILYCLRLPDCDQLLIIDCCYAARAFVPWHIGKRKFELLTSAGVHDLVPSPTMNGSFTKCLNEVLKRLLTSDPHGFSTSRLHRELFHAFPPKIKPRPHLFDQARQDLGKIWLRPQKETHAPTNPSKEEKGTLLKLSLELQLQLNEEPTIDVLMNELARQLQYLPHVDKVDVKGLSAPRRQIENFAQSIVRAQKLRPLIRKIVAKRRLKGLMEMNQPQMVKKPSSIQRMILEQKHHSLYDWSSANPVKDDGSGSRPNGHHRNKSFTWPVAQQGHTVRTKSIYNRLFSIDLAVDIPGKSLMSRIFSRRPDRDAGSTYTGNSTTGLGPFPSSTLTINPTALYPLKVATSPSDGHTWREHLDREETWYLVMFIAVFFVLGCFCFLMKD